MTLHIPEYCGNYGRHSHERQEHDEEQENTEYVEPGAFPGAATRHGDRVGIR